jgi:hypothetical protein
MGYVDYINQIGFKILQPDVPVTEFLKSNAWVKQYITSAQSTGELEVMNTEIPGEDRERIKKLGSLLNIPRMSTFAIAAIINKAVSLMREDLSYVNVGVWNGFTLLSGMVDNPRKTCVGIDNFSQFGGPRRAFLERFNKHKSAAHSFYDMDYRDYFRGPHRGMIGAYLYDGEHSYANQFEGLQVAEPYFADDCLVFVDDTNWSEPRSATLDFISQSANHYEILLDEMTCQNRHPTYWNGFMVLQCRKPGRP